jgi:anaerobic magnesium-protoporphyrin IX monomethyl ester cyclase
MRVVLCAAPFYSQPERPVHLNNTANLGLYLLAAIAEQAGHSVKVVDPCSNPGRMDPADFRAAFAEADALAFSATSSTWAETRRIFSRLKELPRQVPVIAGGAHATLFDEHVLRTSPVDYVVRGEGELAFPELLEAIEAGRDPAGLAGVSCLREGKLSRGPDRPLLSEAELAANPLPRYDLIPQDYYQVVPVETSRGCRHRCAFCSITHPRSWREIGPERLQKTLAAVKPLLSGFTGRAVHIIDDCFLARGRDLAGLAQGLERFDSRLLISTRVSDLLAEGALDFYARLPIAVCEVGVECGYDEGIKQVGKGITIQQVKKLALELRERGLIERVMFSYIVGFPWESLKQCLSTLEFAFTLARRCGGMVQLAWFVMYPGSEIFLHPERFGVRFGPEVYDRPAFWRDPELFAQFHPLLSPAETEKVAYTARFLKELHHVVKVQFWM